jgi:hypothetical protein
MQLKREKMSSCQELNPDTPPISHSSDLLHILQDYSLDAFLWDILHVLYFRLPCEITDSLKYLKQNILRLQTVWILQLATLTGWRLFYSEYYIQTLQTVVILHEATVCDYRLS